MSIILKRNEYKDSAISRIGESVFDIISVPFNFAKDVVNKPFDFVQGTIQNTTGKIVLLAIVLVVGIYVIGKSNILKDVKGILP